MAGVGTNQRLLNVHKQERDGVVHLRVGGELDMATSPVLEEWLAGAESNGNTAIMVDLENVTFIDASGLRPFLRAAERAGRSGRSFAILEAAPRVRRVLQLTQTDFLLGVDRSALPGERRMVGV